MHVPTLPQTRLPSSLPQDIEQSSLCHRVGPNCPGSVKPLDCQGSPRGAETFYPSSPRLLVENYMCRRGLYKPRQATARGAVTWLEARRPQRHNLLTRREACPWTHWGVPGNPHWPHLFSIRVSEWSCYSELPHLNHWLLCKGFLCQTPKLYLSFSVTVDYLQLLLPSVDLTTFGCFSRYLDFRATTHS